MNIEHVHLFTKNGTHKCIVTQYAPCKICDEPKFGLTSMATGKLWNCYTCQCDKKKEPRPKGRSNVTHLSEYKAEKADVPEKG